jgi:hypothetical protein
MNYLLNFTDFIAFLKIILKYFSYVVDFREPGPSLYQTAIKPTIKEKVIYE